MSHEELIHTFKEEALELLGSLEDLLLDLEQSPGDTELLSSVFRVMHTIKGSSGMFGFTNIADFCHSVESFLSDLRDGRLRISRPFIDSTLQARDYILAMIQDGPKENMPMDSEAEDFLRSFSLLADSLKIEPEKKTERRRLFRIAFYPHREIFHTGTRPLNLIKEVRSLGDCIAIPLLTEIPRLREIIPDECYTRWEIVLETTATKNVVEDVFLFVTDTALVQVEEIPLSEGNLKSEVFQLRQKLIDNGDIPQDVLNRILGNLKSNEIDSADEVFSEKTDNKISEIEKSPRKVRESRLKSQLSNSVRVDSDKLDNLMDLIGEIVTIHAQIHQTGESLGNSELSEQIERFGRLTDELRDNTMSIRMLPLSVLFSRFNRVVRDLSANLNKKINLEILGEKTELDKSVIEKLNDPLIHIIRNSIDHGIETPQVRLDAGKSETGTIRINASQNGAAVRIYVEDDGKGLDLQAIKAKALAKGLIQETDSLSEEDVYSLIFRPGFSTVGQVTGISGRGVGMDVVNKEIQNLNGAVQVESREGEFCRIILTIPLTTAIIEGLLVQLADESYIIPLSDVERCLEFNRSIANDTVQYINVADNILPLVDLRTHFAIKGKRPEIEQIVVVHSRGSSVGLLVDQIIGSHQTVIKSLGRLYSDVDGIASSTILGDGTVALVMDVEKILTMTEKDESLVH